jgi:hypothetical protein
MLVSFDIQGCINEQMKIYLQDNALTFAQLKQLLINKKPIPEIHTRVSALLVKAQKENKDQVKKALETQVYKKQLAEDEQENKKDKANLLRDEQLKTRFKQELKKITSLINKHLEEQEILIQRANQFYTPKMMTLPLTLSTPMSNQWRDAIQQHDIKIHFLHEKGKIIQIKLDELEHSMKLNKQRQLARTARDQARVGYQSTKQNLEHTLSEHNKAALHKSINEQSKGLEKMRLKLEENAELIQFKSFLQILPKHLSQMQLKPNELTAIQATLKLMKQHISYKDEVDLLQNSLQKKKETINPLLTKLHLVKERLKLFTTNNPILTIKNEQLEKKIIDTTDIVAQNNKVNRNLSAATWLLLGLTFLLSIPLILTISGTLSFFTPLLLYCFVSIPPSLLLLSTVVVGITALVYFFKARAATQAITDAQNTIEDNIKKMAQNENELVELQLVLLPSLEAQIKREEELRENIQASL